MQGSERPTGEPPVSPVSAIRYVENCVLDAFVRHGYNEVSPPILERRDLLDGGAGEGPERYTVEDRHGTVMTLRADMTLSVAALASGLGLGPEGRSARVCYAGPVFRKRRPNVARPHQIEQVGAEVLGEPEGDIDAEPLVIALEELYRRGLLGLRVGVGHRGLLAAVARGLGADEADSRRLLGLLKSGDLASLRSCLVQMGCGDGGGLYTFIGGCTLQKARRGLGRLAGSGDGAGSVVRIAERLESAFASRGLDVEVRVDLEVVGEADYYTGCVFEVYHPEVGWPVATGGRYDGLVCAAGRFVPAVGIAFNSAEIARVLGRDSGRTPVAVSRAAPCGIH